MNLSVTVARSKKEAVKALESFKWTEEQKQVLEHIAKNGSIYVSPELLGSVFGLYFPEKGTMLNFSLLWKVEYNNGRKLFRKSDISFLPLI